MNLEILYPNIGLMCTFFAIIFMLIQLYKDRHDIIYSIKETIQYKTALEFAGLVSVWSLFIIMGGLGVILLSVMFWPIYIVFGIAYFLHSWLNLKIEREE